MANNPTPHAPINMIDLRGAIPTVPDVPQPRSPALDAFNVITASPMAKPTMMDLGSPLTVGGGDARTGAVAIPTPASPSPSPAVRPLTGSRP